MMQVQSKVMNRLVSNVWLLSAAVCWIVLGGVALAQTTSPGAAIDTEIYNPVDGSNAFCVDAGESFTARVMVRPGTDDQSCALACSGGSTTIPGGSANLATGVVDIAFDTSRLSYVSAASNASTPAVDGLIQDNSGSGRIGWALAGDWSTDADPGSTLADPCSMGYLQRSAWTAEDGWVFEATFQATGAAGLTTLRYRRETDTEPFALSFADICGAPAYRTTNGGIDEVVNGTVLIATDCTDVIFFDGFATGTSGRWSASVP